MDRGHYEASAFRRKTWSNASRARWLRPQTRTYLEAGAGRAKLPGSRGVRLEKEGRSRGIELADAIRAELRALGELHGVPFPPEM